LVVNSHSDISRLWYLVHLPKLGIQLSRKKMDAVMRGDKSGTILHRSFVCGGEALGIVASRDMATTPAMVQFYARQVQASWESVVDLFKGSDHRTKVHVTSSTVPCLVYSRLPEEALHFIQRCCDFVQAGNIQFVPTYGRPPDFSEDFHEISVALSQVIYWANYLFLMRGGPQPRVTAELEKEFRRELPVGDVASILLYIELISTTANVSGPL
jgi:hypothetical protein